MTISGSTRALGIIGWPVAHSRSPAMHNAAFAQLGLDLVYLAFAVERDHLPQAFAGARALGLVGLNVTVPHKEAVLALCAPDAQALAVGAINTVVLHGDGVASGHNTDVHGFAQLVAAAAPDLAGSRVTVLGNGGAARAVVAALLPTARSITLVARTPRPFTVAGHSLPTHDWSDLPRQLAQTDLLVDATSRGLDPQLPAFDLAPLPDHAAVIDLIVKPSTPLLDAARARRLRAAGGTEMLLHQGAQGFTLWTGQPAPLEVMRRALLDTL